MANTVGRRSVSKYKEGQEVTGRILEVDSAKKQVSMTLKKLLCSDKLPTITTFKVRMLFACCHRRGWELSCPAETVTCFTRTNPFSETSLILCTALHHMLLALKRTCGLCNICTLPEYVYKFFACQFSYHLSENQRVPKSHVQAYHCGLAYTSM